MVEVRVIRSANLSSISSTGTDIPVDATLQIAPSEDQGPDFNALKVAFEKVVTDCQPIIDQCRLNYETRYAIWNGQSADGKKHSREGAKIDPTPWDGASDLRVYLTDNVINKKVAMLCMAFQKANLVAAPINSGDVRRAQTVSSFMRWLVQTQMPEVEREVELLSNYIEEKGIAATGQFWETIQEKVLTTINLDDFKAQFPQLDIEGIIQSGEQDGQISSIFEEVYGCSARKANKMIRELRKTGTTSVPTDGRKISRPVLRAFNLDNDLFIPPFTTDIEQATGIYRVQYFTPEKLRSFVNTDGWDNVWVERAIKTCKGRLITITPTEYMQPLSRSFVYTQQRFTDMIGVVYAYQRLSDEDGIPGIYLTIFNPELPASNDADGKQPGYAKFGLLGYAHGQYPFVIHRREFLSRKLHDTRGIPEPGKPLQDQIKAHKDSRIDAASIAVIPPLCYPIGRPPSRWGPGSKIPERRPNEYHYADRPMPDMNTDDSEDRLKASFNDYVGFASREGDPQISPLENQWEVNKFLKSLARAFNQIWKLYQQFGEEQVFFQVVGLKQPDLSVFNKGDPNENYAFYLAWDVQSLDFEKMAQKWTAIIQGVQMLDRSGTVSFDDMLQAYLESIDPNIAERILRPASVGTQQVVNDEQSDITQIAAGFNKDLRPGTPPGLAMQVLQNYLQAPDVQQRLQTDEPFKQRIMARAKQIQFQAAQQQNAQIGRKGALMPQQPMQATG